jgi:hypothetical protein
MPLMSGHRLPGPMASRPVRHWLEPVAGQAPIWGSTPDALGSVPTTTPLYRRIAAELREAVTSGQLPRGSQLPTEQELDGPFVRARSIGPGYMPVCAT